MKRKSTTFARRAAKRRRTRAPVKLSKPLKRVIRRYIGKSLETKTLVANNTDSLTPQTIESYNLLYNAIAQGDTKYTIAGEQFYISGIKIKYSVRNFVQNVTSSGYCPTSLLVHLYVIKTNWYKTTGNLTNAEIFDQGAGNLISSPEIHSFDSDKVKVLAHKKIQFNSKGQGTNGGLDGPIQTLTGSMWVPIKKQVRFKDYGLNSAPNYDLRNGNYYLVAYAVAPDCTSYVTTGKMTYDMQMYIKDA